MYDVYMQASKYLQQPVLLCLKLIKDPLLSLNGLTPCLFLFDLLVTQGSI